MLLKQMVYMSPGLFIEQECEKMQVYKIFACLITFLMFSSVPVTNHGYEFRFSPTQRYIKYHGTITLDITTVRVPNWSLTPAFKEERRCSTTIDFDINFTSLYGDLIFGSDSGFLVGHSQRIPISFTEEWRVTPEAGGTPKVAGESQEIRSVTVLGPDHGQYVGRANALVWGVYKRGVVDVVAVSFAVAPLNVSEASVIIDQTELEWRMEYKVKDQVSVDTFQTNYSILNSRIDINLVAYDLCGYSKVAEELAKAGSSSSDVGANLETARRVYRASFNYTNLKTHFPLKTFSGKIESGDYKITYSGSLFMKVVSEGFFKMIGGEAWVKPYGADNYMGISEYRGKNVKPGDEVKTSSGRTEIALSDGSRIILSPNTTIMVRSVDENLETWSSINLTKGKVEVSLESLVGRELEIQTSNVITRLNSTGSNVQVIVEFDENNMTTVIVLAGEVEVQETVNKNNVSLMKNQKITIPTLPNGLDQPAMSKRVLQIDPSSVERWWEQSFISCSASPETIITGGSVKVSGSLDPSLTAENVTLTYVKPDGSSFNRTATTVSGSFFDVYKPDVSGQWRIIASWSGNRDFKVAISKPAVLTVEPEPFIETPLGMASITGGIIAVAVIIAVLKRRKS